jgi:hypothetical protein
MDLGNISSEMKLNYLNKEKELRDLKEESEKRE